jgi:uncharacterized membrane protein
MQQSKNEINNDAAQLLELVVVDLDFLSSDKRAGYKLTDQQRGRLRRAVESLERTTYDISVESRKRRIQEEEKERINHDR